VTTIRRTDSPDSPAAHPRDGTATRRDQAAEKRDDVATQRDDLAARRDRTAEIADQKALELDVGDAQSDTRPAHELAARGLADRRRAALDRRRAKSDRRLAGADRQSGESDREESRAWGHLAALVDCSEDAIIAKSLDGEIESWNRAAEELFGYTAAEAVGQPDTMTIPADGRPAHARLLAQIKRGERVDPMESVRLTKDGRRLDVAVRVSLVYNAAGELVGASSICRDITERVRMEAALRAAEERWHTAFDRAPIGICLLSLDGADPTRLLQVNPAMAELVGREVGELVGATLSSLAHPEDRAATRAALDELIDAETDHVEFERRLIHRDGHPVWVLITGALLSEHAAARPLAITHIIDISERKRSERQLQHLADHDALTGLFNRRRFTEELARALRQAKRHEEAGAVLFLDLDGFKVVNDSLGHAAGDRLIARVAGLLRAAVRETDTLARIGGDEFAILLTRCDQAAALVVADKLLSTLRLDDQSDPANPADPQVHVSCSVGIAVFAHDDLLSPDQLVVQADIAMYEAKNAGGDRRALYDRAARPRNPVRP
jgi:diguanylate cyclase (GGDEF)-like protein/PAS domain S-box-containing protein